MIATIDALIIGGLIVSVGASISFYVAARALIANYFEQKRKNLRSMLKGIEPEDVTPEDSPRE